MATAEIRGPRRVLAAVDAPARRLGLRPGMTVAQAQARCLELTVVVGTPADDFAGLARLAEWCLGYAPLVALDPPDGLWIEVTGAAHLRGGEAPLLADLVRRIRGGGFAARAAVADTPGAAWAAARHVTGLTVVDPDGQASLLAPLPIAALRLPALLVEELAALGVARVEALSALPRGPLRLRFAEALLRLDQAHGRVPEPLAHRDPPETHLVRRAFAEPVSAPETLARIVAELATALSGVLAGKGLGARRLDLVCRRVDALAQSVSVGTARPSRDPVHLAGLFAERIGAIDPGFGIEAIHLVAARVEPLSARQVEGALGEAGAALPADPEAMAALVDRLTVRLGPDRVFRAGPVETAWPERSVRRLPPLAAATGASWPVGLPRPAHLLDPPEPVLATAMLPDHPPASFTWRRVRRRVARADGPERMFGEWWRGPDEVSACRDYYRVEDEDGARYWLFRDAPVEAGGRWWLHGLGEA